MSLLKFRYSKKATKFCKIFNLDLFYVVSVKPKVEILQNLLALSEYMDFNTVERLVECHQFRSLSKMWVEVRNPLV